MILRFFTSFFKKRQTSNLPIRLIYKIKISGNGKRSQNYRLKFFALTCRGRFCTLWNSFWFGSSNFESLSMFRKINPLHNFPGTYWCIVQNKMNGNCENHHKWFIKQFNWNVLLLFIFNFFSLYPRKIEN